MDLFDAINNRHAYNGFHISKEISEEHLEILLHNFSKAPSQFNSQPWHIVIIREQSRKDRLARLCGDAMRIALAEGDFWEKYGKFFYHDPDNSDLTPGKGMMVDKLPGFLQPLAKFLVTSDSLRLIREKGVPLLLGLENEKLVKKSPVCLAISLNKEQYNHEGNTDFYSTLSLGMAIENMWLTATSLNIGMQFMSMPMEVSSIWREISELIKVPDSYELVALMRMGYKPDQDDRPVLDWSSDQRMAIPVWTSKETF